MCAYGFWKKRSTVSTLSYIHYLVKKVKETAILIDKPKSKQPKTLVNITVVAESVLEVPQHQFTVVLNN